MKTSRHLFQALFIIVLVVATAVAQSFQWQSLPGPNGATVRQFLSDSSGWLYAITDGGVYRSSNHGELWELPPPSTTKLSSIYLPFWITDKDILFGSDGGITIYSTDRGTTWKKYSIPVYGFVKDSNGVMYAGSRSEGLWVSYDTTKTWKEFALQNKWIRQVVIPQRGTLICLTDSALYRSPDGGFSWDRQIIERPGFYQLEMYSGGSLFLRANNSIYRSDDLGVTWKSVNPPHNDRGLFYVESIYAPGPDEVWMGTYYDGIFRSTDRGEHWSAMGIPFQFILSLGSNGNGKILAGTFEDIFLYSASTNQWIERDNGLHSLRISSIAFGKGNTIVATGIRKIFRSTDGGSSWSTTYETPPSYQIHTLRSTLERTLFAILGERLLRSTDDGASWSDNLVIDPGSWISSIAANRKGTIIASSYGGTLYRSTNEGHLWQKILERGKTAPFRTVEITDDEYIYALTDSSTLFFSRNGKEWSESSVPRQWSWTPNIIKTDAFRTVYLSAYNGVLKSTDQGKSWSLMNDGIGTVYAPMLTVDERGNVIATSYSGVYRLADGADKWEKISSGPLASTIPFTAAIRQDGSIFVGTQEHGLFKLLQPIGPRTPTPPETFALFQNYPNPFNATTTIRFDVPISTFVTMKIYNVLGEEVATLLSENSPGRSYTMLWNASPFPSGVYFARLETTQFQRTIKLLLVK